MISRLIARGRSWRRALAAEHTTPAALAIGADPGQQEHLYRSTMVPTEASTRRAANLSGAQNFGAARK
jgi:hypothetical protein